MMMFVSRGKYDFAVSQWERAVKDAAQAEAATTAKIAQLERSLGFNRARLEVADASLLEAQQRLAGIIAMETPGMANVGKRMIRVARGEV